MATSSVPVSSSADRFSPEYFHWTPAGFPVALHMHLDAIDGITRDVMENAGDMSGLLLGRVIPGGADGTTEAWIERYKRLLVGHHEALEAGEREPIGLYRFSPDQPELTEGFDLILAIQPGLDRDLRARVYVRDTAGRLFPVGDEFPFRGHGLPVQVLQHGSEEPVDSLTDEAITRATNVQPAATPTPRRLIHDFLPPLPEPEAGKDQETARSGWRWRPLFAAAAVVAVAGMAFLLLSNRHSGKVPESPAIVETGRPLGLYVNPVDTGTWRVTWNPNATALHDARSVHLFVREGEDQNRIDLAPGDLTSGTYEYRPSGNDVTFRLEVGESSGRVSAESFRMTRAAPLAQTAVVPAAPTPAPQTKRASLNASHPRAVFRVPPAIPASVRPRISGRVPIDVRVKVDTRGRVVSAQPVQRSKDGLHEYLAKRAVSAARQWRFDPARSDGKPVTAEETIHFVFTP